MNSGQYTEFLNLLSSLFLFRSFATQCGSYMVAEAYYLNKASVVFFGKADQEESGHELSADTSFTKGWKIGIRYKCGPSLMLQVYMFQSPSCQKV